MTARRCNWRAVSGGWDDRGQREGPAVASGGRRVPRLRRSGAARRERSGAARREGSVLVGRGSAGLRPGQYGSPAGSDPRPTRGCRSTGKTGTTGTPSDRRPSAPTPQAGPEACPHPPGSPRPARGRAPHQAGPCPDHAPPAPCATAPTPPISPCPGRPCGSSPQAAHCSAWETTPRRPGPWTRPIVAGQEHSPRF